MVQVKEEKKKVGRPRKKTPKLNIQKAKTEKQDVKLEIIEPEKKIIAEEVAKQEVIENVSRGTLEEEKPKTTVPPDVPLDWSHLTPYKRSV